MRHSGKPVSAWPAHIQAQIAAMAPVQPLGANGFSSKQIAALPGVPQTKKRLRQDSAGLNKTEAEFVGWLKCSAALQGGDPRMLVQQVTLLLANGVRYTPDVSLIRDNGTDFYEVKGFMRDDAAVKIKVAARLFQPWNFYLVTKRSRKGGGGWSIEKVLP